MACEWVSSVIETLTDDFGMHAGLQGQGDMRMAQTVPTAVSPAPTASPAGWEGIAKVPVADARHGEAWHGKQDQQWPWRDTPRSGKVGTSSHGWLVSNLLSCGGLSA